MLKITIEFLPGGREESKQVLGVATIALQEVNEVATKGRYRASFKGKDGRVLREVEVDGFPRKRLLAWDLLLRALKAGFGDRNS